MRSTRPARTDSDPPDPPPPAASPDRDPAPTGHEPDNPAVAEIEALQRLATVGILAAAVAHEVNNILTPAAGYLQMAQADPDDAQLAGNAIAKALHAIESASNVADHILRFAARPGTAPDDAAVAEVLDDALLCLGRDLEHDGIALKRQVPADLRVRMAPLALQQVLLNLILNARTAMSGRRGTLSITAMPHAANTCLIRIADTGPGVPATIASSIFDPFVSMRPAGESSAATGSVSAASEATEPDEQSHPPQPARPTDGSGLGLAVCRHLLEQAGGTIELEHDPDRQGASFLIRIPASTRSRAKAG